jgi:CBS domain containing-hemolysin-like protein
MTNDTPVLSVLDNNDAEEPPSWWRQLWRRTRDRLIPPAEMTALREAVEEIIDEQPDGTSGLPNAERMLLANILQLREKQAADCMVPRADITAFDVAGELKKLVDVMAETSHSRIPVYRETMDEMLGMVHMKDVMECLAHQRPCRVQDLVRPVLFVAPSMKASKLLLQMRQSRMHMAMVVDEFGGIDGLVTIEDLVEQIVGEIQDEHDEPDVPDMIVRNDGALLADGRTPIEEFETKVGTFLSAEDREKFDTLGGYVFHLAGHVPQIGEQVAGQDGLRFEVLATDQNRIKRLRVRRVTLEQPEQTKHAQVG